MFQCQFCCVRHVWFASQAGGLVSCAQMLFVWHVHVWDIVICNVCIQDLFARCICPRSLLQPMTLLFTLSDWDWEDVPLFECGIFFILCWACFQLSRCCFLHGRIATTSSQLSSHKTSEAAVQTDALDGSFQNGAMMPETIYVSSGGKCFHVRESCPQNGSCIIQSLRRCRNCARG